jgi:hypothetical protein
MNLGFESNQGVYYEKNLKISILKTCQRKKNQHSKE